MSIEVVKTKMEIYDIGLCANFGSPVDKRILRIGTGVGESKCVIAIESELQIDQLIDELLDIRYRFTSVPKQD